MKKIFVIFLLSACSKFYDLAPSTIKSLEEAKKFCESITSEDFQKFLNYSKFDDCNVYAQAAVGREEYRIIDYTNFDFYFLEGFQNLKKITIKKSSWKNFSSLLKHAQLEEMNFNQVVEENFSELRDEKLKSVTLLTLTDSKFNNAKWLEAFPGVVVLNLSKNLFSDISFLSSHKELQYVDLTWNPVYEQNCPKNELDETINCKFTPLWDAFTLQEVVDIYLATKNPTILEKAAEFFTNKRTEIPLDQLNIILKKTISDFASKDIKFDLSRLRFIDTIITNKQLVINEQNVMDKITTNYFSEIRGNEFKTYWENIIFNTPNESFSLDTKTKIFDSFKKLSFDEASRMLFKFIPDFNALGSHMFTLDESLPCRAILNIILLSNRNYDLTLAKNRFLFNISHSCAQDYQRFLELNILSPTINEINWLKFYDAISFWNKSIKNYPDLIEKYYFKLFEEINFNQTYATEINPHVKFIDKTYLYLPDTLKINIGNYFEKLSEIRSNFQWVLPGLSVLGTVIKRLNASKDHPLEMLFGDTLDQSFRKVSESKHIITFWDFVYLARRAVPIIRQIEISSPIIYQNFIERLEFIDHFSELFIPSLPIFPDNSLNRIHEMRQLAVDVVALYPEYLPIRQIVHEYPTQKEIDGSEAMLNKILETYAPDSELVIKLKRLILLMKELHSQAYDYVRVRSMLPSQAQTLLDPIFNNIENVNLLDLSQTINKLNTLLQSTIKNSYWNYFFKLQIMLAKQGLLISFKNKIRNLNYQEMDLAEWKLLIGVCSEISSAYDVLRTTYFQYISEELSKLDETDQDWKEQLKLLISKSINWQINDFTVQFNHNFTQVGVNINSEIIGHLRDEVIRNSPLAEWNFIVSKL